MNISHPKLKSAVSSIILSDCFFACIILQQAFVEDNSANNPTCAVDGTSFFYNSAFCDSLSFDELKGVVAHEAMHLAGGHHWRMDDREHGDWNKATDYAINGILTGMGYKLPKGALIDSRFNGQSAEDIYRTIRAEKEQQANQQANQKQGQGNGKPSQGKPSNQPANGNGQPSNQPGDVPTFGEVRKPSDGKTKAQAEAENIAQVAKAQTMAKRAGEMSAGVEVEVKAAKAGSIDWRAILHRFFSEVTASDYSYARANKAYMARGIVFPTLRANNTGTIVLVCDTSGSTLGEMGMMAEEIQACMDQYMNDGTSKALTVIFADSKVCGVQIVNSGDKVKPLGGGGTKFSPAFNYVEEVMGGLGDASALVYLTDGESNDFPAFTPSYPVLWGLVRDNKTFNPPFGEVVKVHTA